MAELKIADGRTDTPVVALNGLTYAYATGPPVLTDISLSVSAGEVLAVVGPSGCGKSTLLGLLAGFLRVPDGRISWPSGRPVTTKGSGARAALGMVFQKDTLFPWLTVTENIRFGLRQLRVPKSEQVERCDELLQLGGLAEDSSKYPHQLSGGMRRRVAVLAALATRPGLLLLDEPFSALDEPTRVQLHSEVLALFGRFRMTAVLVTHDLAEAITLADRVLILSNRPARVAGEYVIDLGKSRDAMNLRQEPEYLTLYGRLWRDLEAQIRSAISDDDTTGNDR